MTIGPTRFAADVLSRMAVQPSPITEPEFLEITAECIRGLRMLFGAAGSDQLLIPGTGTAGMEMLAANFVASGHTVVVASTGTWGERWAAICERLGHAVVRIGAPPGAVVALGELERTIAIARPAAIFMTHVDSSTGVCADLSAVGALAQRFDALLLVDGICAAGGIPVEQEAWGIDAYLASTPKALGVPAGLIIVSLRQKAVDQLLLRSWNSPSYSLDLQPWISVFRDAESACFRYFQSPAGNLVMGLHESLRLILLEGLDARYARHANCRRALETGLARLEIPVLAAMAVRSNTVTTCRYPRGHDQRMLLELRRIGLVLPAGTDPRVARDTFRVGHLGNVSLDDIAFTLDCLETVCRLRPTSRRERRARETI